MAIRARYMCIGDIGSDTHQTTSYERAEGYESLEGETIKGTRRGERAASLPPSETDHCLLQRLTELFLCNSSVEV